MSVYKRGRVYYIWPTVPGLGTLPRLSTGSPNKSLARDMEAALRELARTGWLDLVEEVRDGHLTLMELWQSKLEGVDALARLRTRRGNPLLADVVRERLPLVTDHRVKAGYEWMVKLVPEVEARVARESGRRIGPVRLSWVLEPRHVTALYEAAVASGRRPNTVRRGLHRAVSDLLIRRYSRGRMLSVMADAIVPGENDERVVWLTPDEVQRGLAACDVEFRAVVGLALTTGIDRSPMLAAMVHHYDPELGQLVVPDTKTAARPRQLILRGTPLLENAEGWLRELVAGREPHERLVRLSPRQLRTRWDAVRAAIGRSDVRWKDLRGVFATYALLAGMEPRDLQHVMGHSMAMTLRYLRRTPAGNKVALKAAARAIGGYRPELRVAAGGGG